MLSHRFDGSKPRIKSVASIRVIRGSSFNRQNYILLEPEVRAVDAAVV